LDSVDANPFSESAATHNTFREILKEALTDLANNGQETPCHYARVTLPMKRSRSSGSECRYPYKLLREDVSDTKRLPVLAVIKPLSEWTDSVDLGAS
jgi:hypothetical protein